MMAKKLKLSIVLLARERERVKIGKAHTGVYMVASPTQVSLHGYLHKTGAK